MGIHHHPPIDDAGAVAVTKLWSSSKTQAQIDVAKNDFDPKQSVKVVTTGALAAYTRSGNVITFDSNGALAAIDGVTLTSDGTPGSNDGTEAGSGQLLLKDGAAGADNGIYYVSDAGDASNPAILTRRGDANTSSEVTAGMYMWATEGTANPDTGWVLTTNDPITLNTTALTFVQWTGAALITAGAVLTKTGNTIDLDVVTLTENASPAATDWIAVENNAGGTFRKVKVENIASSGVLANISGSTYTTVQDLQNLFHSAGLNLGGAITDAGSNTINVAAGDGFIRATDSSIAELLFFDFSSSSGLSVPLDTTRYVGVEYNAGSPQIVVRSVDDYDNNSEFSLGIAVNEGGDIHVENSAHRVSDHASNMIERSHETLGIARDNEGGGLILGETGTRNVTTSAGALWSHLSRYVIAAVDTSAAGTFDRYYDDGAGGHTKESSQTQWNNTQYDDGSGSLATLGSNKFAVQWFYVELDGALLAAFGTVQHNSLSSAQDEQPPSDVPDRISILGTLIGRIIFKKSEGTAQEIESAFDVTFGGAVVTDHGSLGGLADDDHTIYLLADGTRALAGAWDMDSFSLTNVNIDSGVITGITALAVGDGGTGLSSVGTADQMLGTNAGATANEYKTLATGTAGTNFAIAHTAGVVTFDIPDSSAANRGLLIAADWLTFDAKIGAVTEDTSPRLGGTLDTNSNQITFVSNTGLYDSFGNEQLLLAETGMATNFFTMGNAATGNPVDLSAGGSDSDVGIRILPKGDGSVEVVSGLTIGAGTKHDGFIFRDAAEAQTTDATQTTLDTITLLDENTYLVDAYIIGVQSDGTDREGIHIAATVYRTGAGSATIEGSITGVHDQGSSAASATFTVSGSDVRVSVTGIISETWEWGCTLKYINMSN